MRRNDEIYDVKNFIYLAAMPKSASSLMWLVLSAIQEPNSRPDQSKIDGAVDYNFLPMTIEYLQSFPNGGVYKNHAPIDHHNNHFLKHTGCKYVVLVRHPADQLAALFCHQRGMFAPASLNQVPPERRTPWHFSLGQIPAGPPENEAEVSIDQLIECGYLFKSLMWMTDWIAFRHPEQSRLVRYEDFIDGFENTVAHLCKFLRKTAPDADLMHYLQHVFTYETTEGRKKRDLEKYPRGWSGRIGAWQDYFSDENVDQYNRTVNNFMSVYPQAKTLIDVYPDLNIGRSSE